MTSDGPTSDGPTDYRLTISDLARETGVTPHTLRYYERLGLIPEVERSGEGRHRRYSRRHVGWIRFLRRLRSAEMPIKKLRQYVALMNDGEATAGERLTLLAAHREDVAAKIGELAAHLEILDGKLQRGCGPHREAAIGGGQADPSAPGALETGRGQGGPR